MLSGGEWACPDQVAQERIFADPGQFAVQQLNPEAAVVQLQVGAVVAVPDAGSEEDHVTDPEVVATRNRQVDRRTPQDDGDLQEAVAVDLHRLVVDPPVGVDECVIGEIGAATGHLHRHDGHRRRHPQLQAG